MEEQKIPLTSEGKQQQPSATAAPPDTTNHTNPKEAFFSSLLAQVQFYFSSQNLSRDGYLRNMLTASEYPPDIPMPSAPRPLQFMCPVGVIISFPKVRDIINGAPESLVSEDENQAATLLRKALEGTKGVWSNIVTLSEDGEWIGPENQQLPPPANNPMGGTMPMVGGGQPQYLVPLSRGPGMYPQQGYPIQPQGGPYGMNPMQGMMMVPPPPPGPHGEQGIMYQQQLKQGMPYAMGPSVGSASPSSASIESMPSQQQQKHQQYQQVMNKLDASTNSKVSVGTASGASLSSMSGPSPATGQIPQPPAPHMGQQPGSSAYPTSHGPSPQPLGMYKNISTPSGVAPYPMPPMQQPHGVMPPHGPGGQQPYPYYNQQMMQPQPVAYPPGNYMQQAQPMPPQQGGPQQPPMPPGAYMPHPQMMGYGGMPPPQSQHGYHGPPHPPYSYQGMQQYMDGYPGGGPPHGHYNHGYPPRQQQYNDRHAHVESPGFQHGDHQHQGQQYKKGVDKKKKKNNQQQHGGAYRSGSSSPDLSNWHRRNNGYSSNHPYSQQDRSNSPPGPNDQHQVPGGKVWKKRGAGEHNNSQYYGSGEQQGRALPSSSKHGRNQHSHSHRMSSRSDANSSNRQQHSKGNKKEIFTLLDFPGLGGENDEKSESVAQIDTKTNSNFSGYASALLKKKDGATDNSFSDWENADSNDNMTLAAAEIVPTTADNEVDSLTRQTEEMEREILSEFHDLSLIGDDGTTNDGTNNANHRQKVGSHLNTNDKKDSQTTVATASPSNMDASSLQADSQPATKKMHILPGGPFENDAEYSSESIPSTTKTEPVIDVTNSQDFPPSNTATAGALPKYDAQPLTDDGQMHAKLKSTTGAWGAKKLLADVIRDRDVSSE